jgi:hypothetical protein
MDSGPAAVRSPSLLGTKLDKTTSALCEALVRQAAARNLGPQNRANAEEWDSYIQDLRVELRQCRSDLEKCLSAIE